MTSYFFSHWIELIGYLGSVLVALSLSMKSISRLRRINLIGATTFAVYGLLVKAYPVFLLNGFIAVMDIYYLLQMRRKKDYFELLPIHRPDSPFLKRFLEYYEKDIRNYFPEFDGRTDQHTTIVFVLRNLLPVSLFMARKQPDGVMQICLDYSIPRYRDLQNAHYLYHYKHNMFKELGVSKLVTKSMVKDHINYLHKMGFRSDPGQGKHWFSRQLH